MAKTKQGDTVKAKYTGYLEDSTIFDNIVCHKPQQLTIGRGQVIPEFEEAMVKVKGCPKRQKDCANCEIQDCPEEA
jgi:FKBP-type peptidyl-prolyl cis-trans isomerase 2